MRNMGVAILDMLLKSSKINKLQYNQMYKKLYVEWEIVLWIDLNQLILLQMSPDRSFYTVILSVWLV